MADRSQQALASPDRPVQQCREIFLRQLAAAIEELTGARPNVHGARKQLKRARATLRLLRPAISELAYRRENTVARDAARPLSQARDDEVMSEALEGLLEHFGPAASGLQAAPLRQGLQKSRTPTKRALPARQLGQIRSALKGSMKRANAWRPATGEWDCLAMGLRSTYRKARRALRDAQAERATDALHECRKQTKYLWHQLQVLTPLAAGPVGELADEFHHLADYLGDEHDLAVLRDRVTKSANGMSEATSSALQALIDRRRVELQDKALTLGERLYTDKSKEFVERLTRYWSDWDRRESQATSKQRAAAHPELQR
ncbi:MAG TPA: CHAD domain-containing protein [Steroidobacteraceae bacterium]|nr:CHAD domain-containing protein [Steroidobacteraceae bacterium]